MILIPAVDVLDHRVVQLVGGTPGTQQVDLPDPYRTAMGWTERGAPYLHLVDLDGAFGKGDNLEIFRRIIRDSPVPVEVGGGVRTEERLQALIDAGADRVILGTRAVKEPDWLVEMAGKFPDKVVLGLDTRGNKVVVKGWQEQAPISLKRMFTIIRDLPLAGVLNTNVDVEGQGRGIDPEQVRQFVTDCPKMVIASGGLTTKADAEALSAAGAAAAVVGMAIYKDQIRPWEWELPWVS